MKGTNGLFRLGMVALALAFMVLAGCKTDSDDPSGGGGGKEIYYQVGGIDLTYDRLNNVENIGFTVVGLKDFSDEEKAAVKALTIDSLTIAPKTTTKGGNRSLTLTASGYDNPIQEDGTVSMLFAVKLTRTAAPSDATSDEAYTPSNGTRETSTLTIADSNGYKFVALHDYDKEFQW